MGFPLIYDASATTYTTLGYGVLSEAISCVVTEELNGLFELEMRYPVTGLHGEYVTPGNIIVCTSSISSGRQAFRIYEVTQDISGLATIHARHISYDLNGYPVDTFTASTLETALSGLLSNAVLDTPPFTIQADFDTTADFSVTEPSPIRSWFGGREGSIIDIYGGEWLYDNFSCTLKSRRGADNGARAQYSKNISSYTKNLKNDSQYTHVCAVWIDLETGASVRGDFIETGAVGITRVKFLDASVDFEEQPTAAQLNTYATARAADYSSLALNIAVDVIPLNDIQDIIELGDTVHVYYQNDLYTSRCVSVAWNVIKEKYDRITVGQLRTSFASSISQSVASDGYATKKDVQSMIQKGGLSAYPVGSVMCMNTNTNPGTKIGGTWTLIDKEFSPLASSTNVFNRNTTNVTSATTTTRRAGHSIHIRIAVVLSVAMGETNVQLGSLSLAGLGIDDMPYEYVYGFQDDANGIGLGYINATGLLTNQDVIVKSGTSIESGSSMYYEVKLLSRPEHMLDSACDKFYFRRTA